MKGLLRPCRHQLGPALHARWLGHLCGLCLALRDRAGQSARVLTGYDVLLVSVLTEAQTGRLPTRAAGPCPLRGFRTAVVVDATTPAMRAGTAVALLTGNAALTDKLSDGDIPGWLRPAASRSVRRLSRLGTSSARECCIDPGEMSDAPRRAKLAEQRPGARLEDLLEPAGSAVSAMFAHTATVSGVAVNAAGLSRAGQAFGRLVHLADATQDRESDRRRGRFNPLEATATTQQDAARLARSLHAELAAALAQLELVDGELVLALLGPTLAAAINRVWGRDSGGRGPSISGSSRSRPHGPSVLGVATALVAQAALCGGRRRRQQGPYGEDWSYGPSRGCGGSSCAEQLACDCCADCACEGCCDGVDCCCSA